MSEVLKFLIAEKAIATHIYLYVHKKNNINTVKSAFNEMTVTDSNHIGLDLPIPNGETIRFLQDDHCTLFWSLDEFQQSHSNEKWIVSVFIQSSALKSVDYISEYFNKGRGKTARYGRRYEFNQEQFFMTYEMQSDKAEAYQLNTRSSLVHLLFGGKNCFSNLLPGLKPASINNIEADHHLQLVLSMDCLNKTKT